MRKGTLFLVLACVGLAVALQSCRNDEYLTAPPPVSNQSFTEEFDTVSSALARGWVLVNTSDPKGSGVWQQGGSINPWFNPFSSVGTYAGFIGADYTSVQGGPGLISNWLISPPVTLQNGDKITFYTRSLAEFDGVSDTTDAGNSLQVRLNAANTGTNTGSGNDAGDFTLPLLAINPGVIPSSTATPNPNAYPTKWTRFEATVYGLNSPSKGRFAFRYYVPDGGLCSACAGNGVAIDKVQYQSISR